MKKRHPFRARIRAFHIWQRLGRLPWRKPKANKKESDDTNVKGFFKGSFDSIPFLNDDAKRTFVHLLLRPGHMIRDYIQGKNEIYLAPLTALIIFYAFFALVSSVVHPETGHKFSENSFTNFKADSTLMADYAQYEKNARRLQGTFQFIKDGYILLHLDQYPEAVDSPKKASLAAFEGALRSQGIPLFLGGFLLLWISMAIKLRKYGLTVSGAAAASAYIQCQFCFFMMFVLLLSFGKSSSLGVWLMGILLAFDYHQLLGTGWKKSITLTIGTGIMYGLIFLLFFILLGLLVYLFVFTRI